MTVHARPLELVEYRCPVCRLPVEETEHGNIFGHFDRAGGYCEGSFERFDLALAARL